MLRAPPIVLILALITIAAVAGLGLSRVPRSAPSLRAASLRAAEHGAPESRDEDEVGESLDAREMDAGVRLADPLPETIDTLIVGGGPAPEANEVEIEETVALANQVFPVNTAVLFAGGPDTRSVQVREGEEEDHDDELSALRRTLGDLFSPRNGRDAHYRATTLEAVHGPATLSALSEHLEGTLTAPTDAPLTLILVGHGDGGDTPLDTAFLLWTGEPLDAISLSDLLAPATRRVRMIITSCYAGGLAEIAFEGADPSEGPATQDRCGIFATTWDREASGCDPDPARGARDGYSHHLFRALQGNDAEGRPLAAIDLNDDGVITLLEAHASARITSRSIDVPTSTSSRLLRALAPSDGPSSRVSLADEDAVIRALTSALGDDGVAAMEARIVEVEASQAEAGASLETLTEQSDAAWLALTSALLSRWPVLDDPFHPDFDETLRADQTAIAQLIDTSRTTAGADLLDQRIDALAARIEALELELALLHRWEEARETVALAQHLHARGGPEWARYERMRACEDGTP